MTNDRADRTGEYKMDFDVVNVEHILPQSPAKGWQLTKKEIKDYVNKLGNLTLVGREFNSKMSNKVVEEKIEELSRCEVGITKRIVMQLQRSNYQWGEREILERQREFAQIAYEKVWVS